VELVDRADVLARTNLAELATELCGPPTSQGRSAKWHCPNPDHPDQHPSMSVYPGRRGHPRWKCHACGEGGTAVDLLMITTRVDAGQALRDLANRAGLASRRPAQTLPRTTPAPPPEPPPAQRPSPHIEAFVARAADQLWQPAGAPARRHLHERGLAEPILRANRVGYDPGPAHLPRPRGLPRQGPGIVFPVLDPDGLAVYYQLRYLSEQTAAARKYDQPTVDLAPNPKLARIHTPTPAHLGVLVVCEGIPDALTVAHTGLPAAAILGVAHAGAPPTFRTADLIRSAPKWRTENAGIAQEFHS
jgi:hypothetical protein